MIDRFHRPNLLAAHVALTHLLDPYCCYQQETLAAVAANCSPAANPEAIEVALAV